MGCVTPNTALDITGEQVLDICYNIIIIIIILIIIDVVIIITVIIIIIMSAGCEKMRDSGWNSQLLWKRS